MCESMKVSMMMMMMMMMMMNNDDGRVGMVVRMIMSSSGDTSDHDGGNVVKYGDTQYKIKSSSSS